MGRIDMTYDEVKRRMKNGASTQVIADLNGVTVQAVNAFIKRNKEAEAGLPEPEKKLADWDESDKLFVDKDVIEEIGIVIDKINISISNYQREIDNAKALIEENLAKIDKLINKRGQVQMVIDSLGVKE